MAGTDNYEWFGYDAVCTKDNLVVVSAPGKRNGNGFQALGAVFGYNLETK